MSRITERDVEIAVADMAKEIMAEHIPAGEAPEDHRDDCMDAVHEAVDGHQWVIYTGQAREFCFSVSVDEGEAFVQDTASLPSPFSLAALWPLLVYGELQARLSAKLDEMIEEAQEAFEAAEDLDDEDDEDEDDEDDEDEATASA